MSQALKCDAVELEAFLATMAELFASSGCAREVAILASAAVELEETGYDNWDGGIYFYCLTLTVPTTLFSQFRSEREDVEKLILAEAEFFNRKNQGHGITSIQIIPAESRVEGWRDRAKAFVQGEGINNQGRVRSDNLAPLETDGLLFRSQAEINLYRGLKRLGVTFAPLAVFLRGGENYGRIEPDFIVIRDGIVMCIEVDGDTVHRETPAEAHAKRTMLAHEGVVVERVKASECATPELGRQCAERLVEVMKKHKANR